MPTGSFNSGYGSNGNLTANLQLQGLSDGAGGDWEGMLDKLYWMKNRNKPQPINPLTQMNSAPKEAFAVNQEPMPYRDMMQLNSNLQRDLYSANGTRINRDWQTIPQAAAMSGIKMPRDGWETYAMLANALSGQSGAAVNAASNNQSSANQLAGLRNPADDQMRMYDPMTYRQRYSSFGGRRD